MEGGKGFLYLSLYMYTSEQKYPLYPIHTSLSDSDMFYTHVHVSRDFDSGGWTERE